KRDTKVYEAVFKDDHSNNSLKKLNLDDTISDIAMRLTINLADDTASSSRSARTVSNKFYTSLKEALRNLSNQEVTSK
ncbi:MAG: hypothetical protein QME68_09000, partial [Elusimicrobiota bacterium]|nr:hypothetical protein [Elusimicrobiota bacterium]